MKTNDDSHLKALFESMKREGLNLDMTRGKPCPEQLALSSEMLAITATHSFGVDCRNYGGLDGLPEAKQLFAEYLGVKSGQIFLGGNSSLQLMHDIFLQWMFCEDWDTNRPKFLCPVPGYDRHFAICERYGVEMIPIEMTSTGPNMDQVEKWLKDKTVIAMWCVPKYSNPTGITYSAEVVERLAALKNCAQKHFKIFWDNAYAVHDFNQNDPATLPNILERSAQYGNEDHFFVFGSTSKITFAGGGIGFVAASQKNIKWLNNRLEVQTIGSDKLNQLRHFLFLRNMQGVRTHMQKHADILVPKFQEVDRILSEAFGNDNCNGPIKWSRPSGGYFISLDVPKGCAKRVVELAAELGVKFTPAGATYPYPKDPFRCDKEDSNIRLAPSFPSLEEIRKAMEVLVFCITITLGEKH